MQLSGTLFEQIVGALDAPLPAAPAEPESADGRRRREPRVGIRAQVTLIPLTDSVAAAPFDVPVRDLSPGGIGFLHSDRIGLGQQFVVLLPQGSMSVAVLCEVAYYQPLAERLYAVGARFVRVLRQPAEHADAALSLPRDQTGGTRRAAS